MRIIGGKHKGRNFYMPKGVRPTQDRLRKAVFDILGQDLDGVDFLDLFAGSGAVGMEAVSRNAKSVVFVEKDNRCARVIKENLKALGMLDEGDFTSPYQVLEADVFWTIKSLHKRRRKFDIAFFDPPFRLGLAKKTLKTLLAHDILSPNCLIIAQHEKQEVLPSTEGSIVLVRVKRYGSASLTIYKRER